MHLRQQGQERPGGARGHPPGRDSFRTPAQVAKDRPTSDERRLYELIWQRTVASQMKDATGESVSVRVAGTSTANERAEFGASGKVIRRGHG